MPTNKNVYVSFRATKKEKSFLKLLAEKEDIRLSTLLRQISKDRLEKEGLLVKS